MAKNRIDRIELCGKSIQFEQIGCAEKSQQNI